MCTHFVHLVLFYTWWLCMSMTRVSDAYTSVNRVSDAYTLVDRVSDAYTSVNKTTVGSVNVSAVRRLAIVSTNADLLWIWPLGTNCFKNCLQILQLLCIKWIEIVVFRIATILPQTKYISCCCNMPSDYARFYPRPGPLLFTWINFNSSMFR